MIKLYCIAVILFCIVPFIRSSKKSNNVIRSLFKTQVNRVDSGVKRPVRFCQGFEDPAEIDCYMRSDVKPYVCTEPVSFNPCESLQRVETYHYDHIIHRCIKVNVPACEGQIIRVLTLLQCLIYCHNKDPFALGKSRSMVYKLNQPKPYVPHEKLENERKKLITMHDEKKSLIKSSIGQDTVQTEVKEISSQSEVKAVDSPSENSGTNSTPETQIVIKKTGETMSMENENIDEDIFAKTLNNDSDLANYLINGEPNLFRKKDTLVQVSETQSGIGNIGQDPVADFLNKTGENSADAKRGGIPNTETKTVNEEATKRETQNQKPSNEENVNEKKSQSEQIIITSEEKIEEEGEKKEISKEKVTTENEIKKENEIETKMPKEVNNTDSNDKSKDDGFYLWDE